MVLSLQFSNANTPLAPVELALCGDVHVVACDGSMIMFVYTYAMDGSASYKPCFLLIIAVNCKGYSDLSKWLSGPHPAYP